MSCESWSANWFRGDRRGQSEPCMFCYLGITDWRQRWMFENQQCCRHRWEDDIFKAEDLSSMQRSIKLQVVLVTVEWDLLKWRKSSTVNTGKWLHNAALCMVLTEGKQKRCPLVVTMKQQVGLNLLEQWLHPWRGKIHSDDTLSLRMRAAAEHCLMYVIHM